MIRFRSWRYRTGGRVIHFYGNLWLLEIVVAPRRENRYGQSEPFHVALTRYEQEDA